MWEFIQENSFIIGALTGGLAAYLLSLLVKYFTREKKVLGYSTTSRKIVERGHQDLEIKYRGQVIERLYSHQVIVRNVGNRALKDLPVRISCDGGKLVEFELTAPEGAEFPVTREDDQSLVVDCKLLNRGEHFEVGLTAIDTIASSISVVARAENLKCKEITEGIFSDPTSLAAAIAVEMVKAAMRGTMRTV
jgi:hypothetical protein